MKKKTFTISSGEIELDIIRSSRRTVALYVRPGGTLLIRAPWYVPVNVLMQFVRQKTDWIEKQVAKLKNVRPVGAPLVIGDGSILPFMGRELTVRIIHGSRRSPAASGDNLVLTVSGKVSPEYLTKMVEGWYLREAKAYLISRTAELAAVHADRLPEPREVNIRKMKRRWGTCHSTGAIWLNRELIKKDPALTDYVIIHELCHLVHHNHGSEYYALLESIVPDYRELRTRLRNQQ
jgi:predicted metal-dependent hydrolase